MNETTRSTQLSVGKKKVGQKFLLSVQNRWPSPGDSEKIQRIWQSKIESTMGRRGAGNGKAPLWKKNVPSNSLGNYKA